jgi:hypothetical protein
LAGRGLLDDVICVGNAESTCGLLDRGEWRPSAIAATAASAMMVSASCSVIAESSGRHVGELLEIVT